MVKFRRYPRRFHPFLKFKRKNVYKPYKSHKPYHSKPLPLRYVLLLSFVFFIFSTSLGLWIVNSAIRPTILAYAESQSVNLATYVINKSIREEIDKGLDLNGIIQVDPYGSSTLTTFNHAKIEDAANRITNRILNNINSMEHGEGIMPIAATDGEVEKVEPSTNEGIKFSVPLGRITDNLLLANLGPEIPVEFRAIGDIEYDIETVTKEHQINSTWFEIRLHMKVGIQMLVPFTSEIKMIPRNVLLASGEIKGDVPQFYGNGNGGQVTPSIIIPSEGEGDK
ncbi:sporulation protein YunB [Bacillus andreraoultii]|uniref:sporulation protein YunB n=1 Tax=Bacillus andreraoultii TaxID=1499685 RepID=UPI00067E7359|nr:sporulation protein YunB [Bacillus andreraoultii]